MSVLDSIFVHELTSEPLSLFFNGQMRKNQKCNLRKLILFEEPNIETTSRPHSVSIIDGGALLHKVRWQKDATFSDVFHDYLRTIQKYTNPVIVFDGYEGRSTKDHEHLRRYPVPQSSYVSVSSANKIPFEQNHYLSLLDNKKAFIKALSSFLRSYGVKVRCCQNDSGCIIAKEALSSASQNDNPVLVAAEDTDVAVILLHHWEPSMQDIVFFCERSQSRFSIKTSKNALGDLSNHLIFLAFM